MNLARPILAPLKVLFRTGVKLRRILPRPTCSTFGTPIQKELSKIERIYVINLDRQPDRWAEMEQELKRIVNKEGLTLADLTIRCAAVDAKDILESTPLSKNVYPFYTLADQLFVEPQPLAFPDKLELNRLIPMTVQEIAIALSHISVWHKIADGEQDHVLVLEDDVWFKNGFTLQLDQAWKELANQEKRNGRFDLLYLSYKEAKYGAQKTRLSKSVFRPIRGIWFLSGYALSRQGAQRLLRLLPCKGPIDLWINHHFEGLTVRAISRPIIAQRPDGISSNSYSILPVLNRIGVIDNEGASLFQIRPTEEPVLAFGSEDSGLSSLAMALSMLGYRCCSDLKLLPYREHDRLLSGSANRIFDAYVNIGSLTGNIREIKKLYPKAKIIATLGRNENVDDTVGTIDGLTRTDAFLPLDEPKKWQIVCEHLRCAPPVSSFPEVPDLGQRRTIALSTVYNGATSTKTPKRDRSPWVVESRWDWTGVHIHPSSSTRPTIGSLDKFKDFLAELDPSRWVARNDTFSGNLALFQPQNIKLSASEGATLSVKSESLGVRNFSAAAISSCNQYLFGRFEAIIQVTNIPGVVTGFFLHRDSPRQEIDIEIAGNRPDRLIANVFYNPGDEGTRYDYGYRGAPSFVDLDFDASQAAHCFAIEWEPSEIKWFIDGRLVLSRVDWNPTPIPHLPMALHVNAWPSRSKELAGKLNNRRLPASAYIRSIALEANRYRS